MNTERNVTHIDHSLTAAEEAPLARFERSAWVALLLLGLATAALGALALFWPGPTILVASILLGVFLVVNGVAGVVAGLTMPMDLLPRILAVAFGVLTVLVGLVGLRNHITAIALLAAWVGAGWIIGGATRLFAAGSSDYPNRGLGFLSGLLMLLGGFVVMFAPLSSLAALTTVTGIVLVVTGVMEVVHAIALRVRD